MNARRDAVNAAVENSTPISDRRKKERYSDTHRDAESRKKSSSSKDVVCGSLQSKACSTLSRADATVPERHCAKDIDA